jgi:hypothetical protein
MTSWLVLKSAHEWLVLKRPVTITLDSRDRTMPSAKTRKSDDPVLRIRRVLSEKVQPVGDYWQAVVFPNEGGSDRRRSVGR